MMNKRGMGWGAIVTILLGIVVIIGVSVGIVRNIKTIGEQLIGIEIEEKDEAILEEQFRPSLCEPVQKIVSGITDKTEYYKFSENEEQFYEKISNALINCYDYYWRISEGWKKPQGKKLCAAFDLKKYFEKKDTFSISMLALQINNFLEKNKLKYEPTKSIKNVLEFTPLVEITGGYNIQRTEDPFLCINLDTENKISEMTKCQTTKHLKPVCPVEKETINPEMGWRMTKRKCIPVDLIAEDRMPNLMNKKITKYILSPEEGLCKDKTGSELNLCYKEVMVNSLINCLEEIYPITNRGYNLCTIFDTRKLQTKFGAFRTNAFIYEIRVKIHSSDTPIKYKKEVFKKTPYLSTNDPETDIQDIREAFTCLMLNRQDDLAVLLLLPCIERESLKNIPLPLCKFEEKHSQWQLY